MHDPVTQPPVECAAQLEPPNGEIGCPSASPVDGQLLAIADAWPDLPEHIKLAVEALCQTAS